jgi:hypothetical protein
MTFIGVILSGRCICDDWQLMHTMYQRFLSARRLTFNRQDSWPLTDVPEYTSLGNTIEPHLFLISPGTVDYKRRPSSERTESPVKVI